MQLRSYMKLNNNNNHTTKQNKINVMLKFNEKPKYREKMPSKQKDQDQETFFNFYTFAI